MQDDRRTGRLLGASMLFTFLVGMTSNFKLQAGLFGGAGWIVNAASQPDRIGMVVLLGVLTALVSLATAVMLFVSLRHRATLLASLYLGISVAVLATSAVENVSLYALRSLSEAYVANGTHNDGFMAAKAALGGFRNGVHYLDKLLAGSGVLLMFFMFYRLRLIPRVLSAIGMLAAASQMSTVAAALFGGEVVTLMLAPLALTFTVTAFWLLWKGFFSAPDAPTSVGSGGRASC